MKKNLSLYHNYLPPSLLAPEGKKSPILFLIHGYGVDENDLFSLSGELPGNFHVVAPRAIYPLPWGGYAWYSINFDSGEKFSNGKEAFASRDRLADFIKQAIEAYDADPDNVWILGFSQGAVLSYGLMSDYPSLARYYMPFSGYIDSDVVSPQLKDGTGIKAIAMHGTEDPVIPIEWGRQVQSFMKERGVDYRYYEYPIGHGISPEGFARLREWVDENLKK